MQRRRLRQFFYIRNIIAMAITIADATRIASNKAFEAFVCAIADIDLQFKDVYGVVRDFNLSKQELQSRMRLARRLAAFFRWSVIDGIKRRRIDDIAAASLIDPRCVMPQYEYITADRFVQPMCDVVRGLFWVDRSTRRPSSPAAIAQRLHALCNAVNLLRNYEQAYGNDACKALVLCINKAVGLHFDTLLINGIIS
jgi:hypothetical protein